MKTILELHDIKKQYKDKIVVEKASFSLYDNKTVALVGKNGSGKSTLLKIIAGLLKPDSGSIYKHKETLKIGYVPEVTPRDLPFTPEEYLTHMGIIRGMERNQLKQKINDLLHIFNLQGVRNIRISKFSKGMKQKVTIMQALLEDTDILILDEPLSGLDIKTQNDLEEVLLTLKEKGLSIVLTIHETKLLEKLVDIVLLIENNTVVPMNTLLKNAEPVDNITFELPMKKSLEELLYMINIQHENHLNSEIKEFEIVVKREHTNQILIELIKIGALIRKLNPVDDTKAEFYNHF